MRIQSAEPSDSDAILELIRTDCLPGALLPYSPYGQHGASAWLRESIASGNAVHKLIMDDARTIVAYVQYRHGTDGDAFVNYLYVAPGARGRGLASRMLATVAQTASGGLSLDAFDMNAAAHGLYNKHGFKPVTKGKWLTRTLAPVVTPTLEAPRPETHSRFGFSLDSLTTPTGSLPIGLLGDNIARVYDRPSFTSTEIASLIQESFPKVRHLLLIENGCDSPPGQARVLAAYTRYRSTATGDHV